MPDGYHAKVNESTPSRTISLSRTIYRQARDEMRRFLPDHPARVLEVGCDEGDFGAGLSAEVWGVEPQPEAAAIAASRLHRVLVGTYDAVRGALPDAYFDLIVCNDVIEHMADHEAFLRRVRAHLAPGGALVGSVPNLRHYRALFELLVLRDWHYRESGVLDRTHLRFFTARSLRRGLEQNGYSVDLLHGINGGIRFSLSRQHLPHALFAWTLIGLSLGAWRDIRHLQLAFRARPL
jgi:2-polyprenyl-3-methyl-5-hydroxy-6-metoxy-1,4-benzoquinol methylase